MNQHIGSDFDDFLEEEGILSEVEAAAIKRVIAKCLANSHHKRIEDAPDDSPLSLDEINEIVHDVRRQSHRRSTD